MKSEDLIIEIDQLSDDARFELGFTICLNALEHAAKSIVRDDDRESFKHLVEWVESILGQALYCLDTGKEYRMLIDRSIPRETN